MANGGGGLAACSPARNEGETSMMNSIKWPGSLFLMTAGANMLILAPALAQSPTEPVKQASTLEEVVVTAEKRESTLQSTALAIGALSGDQLATRQVGDVQSLVQSLPNIQLSVFKVQPKLSIRGVGLANQSVSGPEPRIAFHLDGVYLARPEAVMGAYFDVDRVEIIRGPQGTLYGRNATGGAINVISKDPTAELGGYLNVGYGNYDAWNVEGAVSGPLGERVSARLAFKMAEHDGYTRNIITGNRVDEAKPRAVRGKMRFELAENLDILVSGDYAHEKAHSGAYHYLGRYNPAVENLGVRLGGIAATEDRTIASDYDPRVDRERYGFGVDVRGTLGSVDVRSITGYRALDDANIHGDVDLSSLPLSYSTYFGRSRQTTEELRFSQELGRFEWLLGAYFFHEDLSSGVAQSLAPAAFIPGGAITPDQGGAMVAGRQDTDAYAGFGQLRFAVRDDLTLSVGARYGWEETAVNEITYFTFAFPLAVRGPLGDPRRALIDPAPVPAQRQVASRKETAFTPKVTVEYKPVESLMLYATYAEGFKSGGFNLGAAQPSFAPEELTDYELGMKARWFDNRLQANVAAFHYDYSNLQVTVLGPTSQITTAAGRAEIDGAELELVANPIEQARLELNYAWLDARYTRYFTANINQSPAILDLAGNRLTQAPEHSLTAAAQYTWPTSVGDFTLRGEGRWVSRVFNNQFNELVLSTPSYDQFNVFLNYSDASGKWNAGAYVRNLTDKTVRMPSVINPGYLGFPVAGALEPPRLYGVTMGYRF